MLIKAGLVDAARVPRSYLRSAVQSDESTLVARTCVCCILTVALRVALCKLRSRTMPGFVNEVKCWAMKNGAAVVLLAHA